MELYQLFADCVAAGKRLPSFIPLIERSQNPELISFLIEETAYWGSDEEVRFLMKYFQSSYPICRKSSFKAMGIRRLLEAEEEMKNVFYTQTEELRRTILYSLLQIGSGKSVDFLQKRCVYLYLI